MDLSWSTHCQYIYIIEKSNRRLYALRKLKGCGVQDGDLVAVYCSLQRSVLEYALVVFANLPQYLCMAVEIVQRRALRIIFGPDVSYEDALVRAGLSTVSRRQTPSGVQETYDGNYSRRPILPLISSGVVSSQSLYSLRSGTSCHVLLTGSQNSCQLNMRRILIMSS